MAEKIELSLPAYRKQIDGNCFVKIMNEEQYVWIQVFEQNKDTIAYRYEKVFVPKPRGLPSIFVTNYIESNEKEFLGAVEMYIAYSEKLKSHLNSKK